MEFVSFSISLLKGCWTLFVVIMAAMEVSVSFIPAMRNYVHEAMISRWLGRYLRAGVPLVLAERAMEDKWRDLKVISPIWFLWHTVILFISYFSGYLCVILALITALFSILNVQLRGPFSKFHRKVILTRYSLFYLGKSPY